MRDLAPTPPPSFPSPLAHRCRSGASLRSGWSVVPSELPPTIIPCSPVTPASLGRAEPPSPPAGCPSPPVLTEGLGERHCTHFTGGKTEAG